MPFRTDLAIERLETGSIKKDGYRQTKYQKNGISITELTGDEGKYITMELEGIVRHEQENFLQGCTVLSEQLSKLYPMIKSNFPVLVAGLGNRAVTPDALGPLCCENVLATRHLVDDMPILDGFRPVSVIATGVLGTTGIETGEMIMGLLDRIKPELIIAVDALAAYKMNRLMKTIQISDVGIIPGSGVGNARFALTKQKLGVPVISVGVPTVIDTETIAQSIKQKIGNNCDMLKDLCAPAIITTRDADKQVSQAAKMIGYAINLFLHPMLTFDDISAFLA